LYGAAVVIADPERFWDERARENALFFVDNTVDYRDPDVDAFWSGGVEALDRILGALGVEVGRDERVVDIGCGVGRMTRALAERAERVVGIDVSSEMLALAREHNAALANAEWMHGDGTSLAPIADASVDGCFSHVVFQHIPDPEITLGYVHEMGRVLRPGGWAAFIVSTSPAVHRLSPAARIRAGVRALARRGPRAQADPAWLGSWVEPEALEAAAADAGMTVERMVGPGTQLTAVLCRRLP
jgi:SAM-dependent methyltransferase